MRIASLGADQWLGVITRFSEHRAPSWLEIIESTNACRSWTTVTLVKQSGRRLDNGNLLRMPDGALLLTCRSLIDGEAFRWPVFRSSDDGRTWSALSNSDSDEGASGSCFGEG